MTDNDIIKALEIHADNEAGCSECPIYHSDTGDTCAYELAQNALDLINRQKAEIERLSKVRCHFPNDNYCKVVEVNEENEILKEENKRLIFDLETAKTEVITEFEERLKKYYNRLDISQGNLISFHIDQIAKEMKEGVNNA